MIPASIPQNETARIAQLKKYDIMDSFSEKDYDDITLLAATICKAPISLITLIDEERQWFKSHHGLSVSETKREYAFCAHALNKPDEMLIVPDSRKDTRFEDNPLVTGEPHVIFYTGVPLITPEGFPLGTLCVIDNKPRNLSADQLSALQVLSKQVINLLELRKTNQALQNTRKELEARNEELLQFAYIVSHDIKAPVANITVATQFLQTEYADSGNGAQWMEVLQRSADKINNLVDGILNYYIKSDDSDTHEPVDLAELLKSIIFILSPHRQYQVNYPKKNALVTMNKTQLEQIFLNLISNSIRYNDKDLIKIDIDFWEDSMYYKFSVTDNGIGIAVENRNKIFNLFTTIAPGKSSIKKGYGIGLATIKKVVEKNAGTIEIDSTPGIGTKITFSIKKPATSEDASYALSLHAQL